MKELDERLIWRHVRKAQEIIEGEHQHAEYVSRLASVECAEILAASPEGLPFLAARRDECRVRLEEKRSFEEVTHCPVLIVREEDSVAQAGR